MENLEMDKQNVISLFGNKKETESKKEVTQEEADMIFSDAIKRNEENRKKLLQNRLQANKSVIKSYRLKK